LGISVERLRNYHHVYQLPSGIRWQIDEGKIKLGHATQIARLPNPDDQWVLAFSIFTKNLTVESSREVVNSFLKSKRLLRDILHELIGIRFDQIDEPLFLTFLFSERLELCKTAWSKRQNWADFCLGSIRAATRIDLDSLADRLTLLAEEIRSIHASK